MNKTKTYSPVHFSADVLREADRVFRSQADPDGEDSFRYTLEVEVDNAVWKHDSLSEFYSDYRRMSDDASYWIWLGGSSDTYLAVSVDRYWQSRVIVAGLSRPQIETVFEVFERHVDEAKAPKGTFSDTALPKPSIFIGHGRNTLWRDLKDHLQDQQGYAVQAYEVGARAGHTIRDILEEMLDKSTFAILVMTGEDETTNNELRPRLNVVHELGLFQGRTGFTRAIMLLEDGTEEFSNMHGVEQIRFAKDNIREAFGDVLATIRREFP